MNIITLTTDFGLQDYSVGALKGQLYQLLPEAKIVDISHLVTRYDIAEAAYLLQGAYRYFPEQTVHIIGVNNELHSEKPLLLLSYEKQYFITADNGFVSLFTKGKESLELYRISLEKHFSLFPTLDFSAKVAQLLCQGVPVEQIGIRTDEHLYIPNSIPKVRNQRIEGNIIYIDHFGNLVSNISKDFLFREAKGRSFDVYFRYQKVKNIHFEDILSQYNQIEKSPYTDGTPFLIFNLLGYLEMAIYKGDPASSGSSASLIGMKKGDPISIQFTTT